MKRALSIASVVLCAGSLIPAHSAGLLKKKAPPKPIEIPAQPVYYSGVELRLVPESPVRKQRVVTVGPWIIGGRVGDGKPSDKRLNMYIVAPGKQYQLQDYQAFDHNLIISALPKEDKQAEYDVWWALVLDPSLEANFQDEHELILAAQGRFAPSKNFDVKEAPSYAFLRRFLNVQNNVDLEEYFRADRTLPRVLIVPAKFALRAGVESVPQPETPAPPTAPAADSAAQPKAGSDGSPNSAEPTSLSPAENSTAPDKPESPRM